MYTSAATVIAIVVAESSPFHLLYVLHLCSLVVETRPQATPLITNSNSNNNVRSGLVAPWPTEGTDNGSSMNTSNSRTFGHHTRWDSTQVNP